jgi:hypothetical protein
MDIAYNLVASSRFSRTGLQRIMPTDFKLECTHRMRTTDASLSGSKLDKNNLRLYLKLISICLAVRDEEPGWELGGHMQRSISSRHAVCERDVSSRPARLPNSSQLLRLKPIDRSLSTQHPQPIIPEDDLSISDRNIHAVCGLGIPDRLVRQGDGGELSE